MKKIILLLCLLTMFVFSGCSQNTSDTMYEEASGTISSSDVVYLDGTIKTNTERIKVKFNSDYVGITVYLFNTEDASVAIQEKEIKDGVAEFNNLTAATKYQIGITGEVNTKYEAIITD